MMEDGGEKRQERGREEEGRKGVSEKIAGVGHTGAATEPDQLVGATAETMVDSQHSQGRNQTWTRTGQTCESIVLLELKIREEEKLGPNRASRNLTDKRRPKLVPIYSSARGKWVKDG